MERPNRYLPSASNIIFYNISNQLWQATEFVTITLFFPPKNRIPVIECRRKLWQGLWTTQKSEIQNSKCLFVGVLPIICTRIGCMWITHRPWWHTRVQLTICQVRATQSIVMSHFDKQQNLSARPFSLQRKQDTLGFVLFNANVRTASSAPLQPSTGFGRRFDELLRTAQTVGRRTNWWSSNGTFTMATLVYICASRSWPRQT